MIVLVELMLALLAMLIRPEFATPDEMLRVPPVSAIVPPLLLVSGAATEPCPLRVAPLPIVRPAATVNVPVPSCMVPLVMLSAAPIVRLPLVPIPSVWLALLIEIAAADVAVP